MKETEVALSYKTYEFKRYRHNTAAKMDIDFNLHNFLVVVLVILISILVAIALATLYQKVFMVRKRRRRYTLYDDSTISYNMRAPLIKSHSFGAG